MTAMFNSAWSGMALIELALIVGASFAGGVGGVSVLFAVSATLGATFGALSNGFALIMRQEEALIGAVQFIVLLLLTFLSSTFLQSNLMPAWIRHVSDFNPVNWGVVAGRAATAGHADWGLVGSRARFLVALLALCLVFARRAFRSYQRSV